LDADRRRVLSDFYREEFLRHLQFIESSGLVGRPNCEVMSRVYRKVLGDLDSVCCRSEFPALAETLLQRFDALTGLSRLHSRRCH